MVIQKIIDKKHPFLLIGFLNNIHKGQFIIPSFYFLPNKLIVTEFRFIFVLVCSSNKFITAIQLSTTPMNGLTNTSFYNTGPKLGFRTKLISRVDGKSKLELLNKSVDVQRMAQTSRLSNIEDNLNHKDIFAQTASKLNDTNFSHHSKDACLCNQCYCGRHLCQMKVIKPDLTKNTVYQKSFLPQKAIPNIVNHDKEYDKLKGPHLDMNSTQREGFQGKAGDKIQRPKPEDLLHSLGPCSELSTYSSHFPGYRGDNQYVKPTDKHTRAYFPLRSKSTYANAYISKDPLKDDYTYIPDQLKTGYNWLGKTTYGEFFNSPNPQYFAKKVKMPEKADNTPEYNRQYQTIYKNDFIKKDNPLCPSKIYLQTKAQGTFRETKLNFAENTDFKSLSPQFQAIAISKHSFV